MLYTVFILISAATSLNVYMDRTDGLLKKHVFIPNFVVFLGLIIFTFYSHGWEWGLTAISYTFIVNFVLIALLDSSFMNSVKKSLKLKALQAKIAPPPNQTIEEICQKILTGKERGRDESLLNEYINYFCINDPKIGPAVAYYKLSRDDIKELYKSLQPGLGWARGHYIPLSTLSYVEPFMYLVQAKKRKEADLDIAHNLYSYWQDNAPLSWRPIILG